MNNRRARSWLLAAALLWPLLATVDASAQPSAFYRIARQEQAKAQNHLREGIRIAERSLKMLETWQSPEDLKRAEKVIVDAYLQLNEARDATQRAGGAMTRSQNLSVPDPMAAHLITIIDKARDAMRGAHQHIAEAAVFVNGREAHIAQAVQNIVSSMQHNEAAQSLNF
jgi:hypothetical protein